MNPTLSVLLAGFLVLLVLPGASAQDSAPRAELAIVEHPATLGPVEMNGTATVTVKVQLTASNFGCTEAASLPATLTATPGAGAPTGITVEPATADLTFAVGQGLYSDSVPVAPPYTGVAEGMFTLTNAGVPDNVTFPLTVAANFPGGLPAACQSTGSMPAADAAPMDVEVTALAPPPAPEPEPVIEEESFLPGVQVLGAIVAFVVASAFGRRRA